MNTNELAKKIVSLPVRKILFVILALLLVKVGYVFTKNIFTTNTSLENVAVQTSSVTASSNTDSNATTDTQTEKQVTTATETTETLVFETEKTQGRLAPITDSAAIKEDRDRFYFAVKAGETEIIKHFLQLAPDTKTIHALLIGDDDGNGLYAPFRVAAGKGRSDLMIYMLGVAKDRGIPVKGMLDKVSKDPVGGGCTLYKNTAVIKLLTEQYKANNMPVHRWIRFECVAREGDINLAKYLLTLSKENKVSLPDVLRNELIYQWVAHYNTTEMLEFFMILAKKNNISNRDILTRNNKLIFCQPAIGNQIEKMKYLVALANENDIKTDEILRAHDYCVYRDANSGSNLKEYQNYIKSLVGRDSRLLAEMSRPTQ